MQWVPHTHTLHKCMYEKVPSNRLILQAARRQYDVGSVKTLEQETWKLGARVRACSHDKYNYTNFTYLSKYILKIAF